MLLFYETGIFILSLIEKKRERDTKLQETETDKPDE
jgi:Sec-independent protein secretion pathway component TatC